jgi:hypothetical protein
MTKRIQTVQTVGAMALVFILQACGGSNNGMTGAAGTTGSAGSGSGVAGTTGSAGSGVAGTTGTGGSSATGAGGTTTAAAPSCIGLLTAAGMEPAKNIACTPSDVQLCTRTCGPEKSGLKNEMCTSAGSYSEMSGCTFDMAKDFSCYKIPTAPNTACPAGVTPQGSMDCTVPTCTVCNSTQGTAGGQYLDSSGAAKPGYCVCQAADANGNRKWSCASDNGSWPCPLGKGC